VTPPELNHRELERYVQRVTDRWPVQRALLGGARVADLRGAGPQRERGPEFVVVLVSEYFDGVPWLERVYQAGSLWDASEMGGEAEDLAESAGYAAQALGLAVIFIYLILASQFGSFIQPVAIMTKIANVLLVRPDFPAKTPKEFIDYAKANPGKVNYASQGIGTTSHLTAELFSKKTG